MVVRDENLIARGRNLIVTQSDPTAHAETVALRNAGNAMRHTDFSGFTLYTTFEPCPMCCGAILASGVSTLVLGARFQILHTRPVLQAFLEIEVPRCAVGMVD